MLRILLDRRGAKARCLLKGHTRLSICLRIGSISRTILRTAIWHLWLKGRRAGLNITVNDAYRSA